jgi:hypothetical protein
MTAISSTDTINNLVNKLQRSVSIAPLVVFRIVFGALMAASSIRFVANGWVHELYGTPKMFFSYYGFDWLPKISETVVLLLFILMTIAYLMVMLGWFYKWSASVAFVTFTYTELLDKTTYLNHYYFCSLISFLLIFLPAHRYFSVDSYQQPSITNTHIPFWMIGLLQVQLGIVYFYAGLAKLNPDWLLDAMPLRFWLTSRNDLPVIGSFLDDMWVAYLFSWFGAIYDLVIPFVLWSKRWRPLGYLAVVIFHVLTRVLFPIGMFPFIMISATLIFFSEEFHLKLLSKAQSLFKLRTQFGENLNWEWKNELLKKGMITLLVLYLLFQFIFPFRYALYPGKLFWTEQGFRFSWRVMLMEKAGVCFFYVKNPDTGMQTEVIVSDHLTPLQEKMMSTQPDMIIQFAHYLDAYYKQLGVRDPQVFAKCKVALNGARSKEFIDPNVDLSEIKDSWANKTWIRPFENE